MKKSFSIKYIALFFIVLIALSILIIRAKAPNWVDVVFEPVSVVTKVVADAELASTDGRTNVLILGTDRRVSGANVTPGLTDTIMVISIDKAGRKPVLISIPRDLWISVDEINYDGKINGLYNTVYQSNLTRLVNQNVSREEAAERATSIAVDSLKDEIENIIGTRVHYNVVIGFTAFTEAIDALGGVNVNVERSFTDYKYPVEGMEDDLCGRTPEELEPPVREEEDEESDEDKEDEDKDEEEEFELPPPEVLFPCRYETISYTQGLTTMNGVTALKYARSRHSLEDGGDFNRARRQQKVVEAVKNQVFSAETIFNPVRIKDLYESYRSNVNTNISLSDAILFYEVYRDVELGEIERIVLSDEISSDYLGAGTLFTPSSEERISRYRGLYVLLPVSRSYGQIHALVRETLFDYNDNTDNR